MITLLLLLIVVVRTARLGGWWFDTQAFPASGADVDGAEPPVLDTLHDGLAGDAVGEGGLEHGQPAVGGVVDEQGADVGGAGFARCCGGSCSPAMNPSFSQRCKVDGASPSSAAASATVSSSPSCGSSPGW